MHARAAQNVAWWNRRRTWVDNDKTDGEGQVCTGQTSGVEGAAAYRSDNVATSTATAPENTAAAETTTMDTIVEARDVAPKITKVEEEAVATEEIAAMQTTPKRHTPMSSSST